MLMFVGTGASGAFSRGSEDMRATKEGQEDWRTTPSAILMEGVGGGLLYLAVEVMRAEETLHTFTGDSQTAGQGDGRDGVLRDQGREAACKGRENTS